MIYCKDCMKIYSKCKCFINIFRSNINTSYGDMEVINNGYKYINIYTGEVTYSSINNSKGIRFIDCLFSPHTEEHAIIQLGSKLNQIINNKYYPSIVSLFIQVEDYYVIDLYTLSAKELLLVNKFIEEYR